MFKNEFDQFLMMIWGYSLVETIMGVSLKGGDFIIWFVVEFYDFMEFLFYLQQLIFYLL
jgi:hypothetical protein